MCGTVWLGYLHPSARLVLNFGLDVSQYPQGGYFCYDHARRPVANTDAPWLFLAGVGELRRCVIPVQPAGAQAVEYSVHLAFAELEDARPGQRVFDIKLQDKFDI